MSSSAYIRPCCGGEYHKCDYYRPDERSGCIYDEDCGDHYLCNNEDAINETIYSKHCEA